ncbi:hypothetical protein DdX_21701 [Ditylenchus destructor]|uniref:Uncharacterized protein n=1 Tax=Ditylenchus destructor TaxID=166010 RepID=A0AAD4QSX3_9BILA|nr:hypothetical protein DdX_21701 [Ditylenchus destructor]
MCARTSFGLTICPATFGPAGTFPVASPFATDVKCMTIEADLAIAENPYRVRIFQALFCEGGGARPNAMDLACSLC